MVGLWVPRKRSQRRRGRGGKATSHQAGHRSTQHAVAVVGAGMESDVLLRVVEVEPLSLSHP
jgi:hypothetical protein